MAVDHADVQEIVKYPEPPFPGAPAAAVELPLHICQVHTPHVLVVQLDRHWTRNPTQGTIRVPAVDSSQAGWRTDGVDDGYTFLILPHQAFNPALNNRTMFPSCKLLVQCLCVPQWYGPLLAIDTGCGDGIRLASQWVSGQFHAGEEIIIEQEMVLVHNRTGHCLDNGWTQIPLCGVIPRTQVWSMVDDVPIVSITAAPHLEPPFCGFHRHILLYAASSFKCNHCLIN